MNTAIDRMKEITVFGRGGQGAVVASEILAEAYFHEGYHVQCFPSFGVERRGAPVMAFLRVDKEFIFLRSNIYKADMGLVLSHDVVKSPTFKPSLSDNASLVINSKNEPGDLSEYNVFYIDANKIALEYGLGSKAQPIVSTAMVGAFAKAAGDLKLDNLLKAVESKVPMKIKNNLKAVRKAFESVEKVG